jgi:Uncharacterized conserved protein
MELLASCLHDLTALGPGGHAALMLGMLLAGLAGGATHCALMCAPFVLAQVAAGADRSHAGGALARMSGAALLPYHLGRMLGYGLLGALAGMLAGVARATTGLGVLLAIPLALAALVCLLLAIDRAGAGWLRAPALPAWAGRMLARLAADPRGARGVAMGLLLSALPCGLLYGALAGAAASGSALGGALAMAAFVLGTIPALIAVALSGRLLLRQAGAWLRPAGTAVLLANALLLAVLAARQLA